MAETLSRVTMETGGAADRDRLQGRGDETAAEDDPMLLLIKAAKQEVDVSKNRLHHRDDCFSVLLHNQKVDCGSLNQQKHRSKVKTKK